MGDDAFGTQAFCLQVPNTSRTTIMHANMTTIGTAVASASIAIIIGSRLFYKREKSDDNVTLVVPPNLGVSLTAIREFPPFKEWYTTITQNLASRSDTVLHSVTVRDVYMFGNRIGFVFLDAHVTMGNVRIPGAVFLRGPSVAVLLWHSDGDGNVYVVMVRQPRVAVGKMMWEVPAGMIDGNGDVKSRMFDEIREETGLTVNVRSLVHHTDVRPYTSCGILDEKMELFSMEVKPSILKSRTSFVCGNVAEGEVISNVEFISVDDPRAMEDGKLHMLMSVIDP